MRFEWTDKKVKLLIESHKKKLSYKEISQITGATEQQIANKLSKMKIKRIRINPKQWSDEEIALLKKVCEKTVITSKIKHLFPLRTTRNIVNKRFQLGLSIRRAPHLSSKKGGTTSDMKTSLEPADSNLDEILGNLKFTCKYDNRYNVNNVLGNRIISKRGQIFLDGKPVLVQVAIRTANAILKESGKKQLGGVGLWV